MIGRTSYVRNIDINSIAFSSIAQIGDSDTIHAVSNALAVQREAQVFYGWEGNFSAYPVFTETIPLPPIYEDVSFEVYQENPFIKVGFINLKGISSSSFLHVGNSNNIYLEARVKHIRQLLDSKD